MLVILGSGCIIIGMTKHTVKRADGKSVTVTIPDATTPAIECRTAAQIEAWDAQAMKPADDYVGDYSNPAFALANVPNDLLLAIAAGDVDIKLVARHALWNRGYLKKEDI